MPKVDRGKTTTVYLPEEMLEQIAATGETTSEVVRKALAAYFHRAPTEAELAEALSVVFRAAKARKGEDVG